ncbi:MAG: hypothetical protein HY744_02555 [Deltaproteobacteria bacterium]|nr:hypothetical protein [Deltaproteobacteria bacterium]
MAEPEETGLRELRRYGRDELEALYARERELSVPEGLFRGVFLGWIDMPLWRHPFARFTEHLGFRLTPFGVDFDRRLWFFWRPALALGRFTPEIGPSRWREARTVRLRYEPSRLPRPVRGLLYDEVKPLSRNVCLGLGGINAPRGWGDHFYFALVRS